MGGWRILRLSTDEMFCHVREETLTHTESSFPCWPAETDHRDSRQVPSPFLDELPKGLLFVLPKLPKGAFVIHYS